MTCPCLSITLPEGRGMRSPRLPRRLILSLAMALGLATMSTGLAQSAPTPVTTAAEQSAGTTAAAAVTFSDEFDGAGHLVITARKENPGNYQCWYGRCEYTSARLNTSGKFSTTYGRVEARMKIPRGQGIWPAFWMLGSDIGSMENVGFEPGTVHGTLHGPGYSGSGGIGAGYSLPGGQAFADAFHTFAVDWSPNAITWSVDGTVYQRRTPADLGGRQWVFNKPFFVILNLAVGGYWPGDPDGSTALPQQLVVEHVRVTTGDAPGTGARITGIGGKCVDVAAANTANGTPIQLY